MAFSELIWCVQACAGAFTCPSHPGLRLAYSSWILLILTSCQNKSGTDWAGSFRVVVKSNRKIARVRLIIVFSWKGTRWVRVNCDISVVIS